MIRMMQISKEYASALFMLACEKEEQKNYKNALKTVKDLFSENSEYVEFLKSLSIPLGEKISAVRRALSDAIPEDVLSFVLLLCEKGRISCFFEVVEEYENLYDELQKTSKAKVTSAAALTDEEKKKLEKKLSSISKKDVFAEYEVDESLIGGIVVEIDGKVLDGSVKRRLRDIKDVIIG